MINTEQIMQAKKLMESADIPMTDRYYMLPNGKVINSSKEPAPTLKDLFPGLRGKND